MSFPQAKSFASRDQNEIGPKKHVYKLELCIP